MASLSSVLPGDAVSDILDKKKSLTTGITYVWFLSSMFYLVCLFVCLFVCFVALRPKSTAMVMAGRSGHLTTLFPWQAGTSS